MTTFFDYEKAYDKVWRDGLLYKMINMDLPDRFIRYVRHFLSGRKTKVEVNGERSDTFRLDQGLPQGSSISPLLFLIFINDIDVDLNLDTIASLFADDTSAWMKDGEIRGSNRTLMQVEIDKIVQWAEKWKMKINVDKTKAMVMASTSKDSSWDPKFTVMGENIKTVQEYKFLGVTVDSELRFRGHIANISTKCTKRVNIIKCMSGKDWGNNLETQRALYLTYIRSVLEYASSSWNSWISPTNLKTLQRIQNAALRSIASQCQSCPQNFLHLETNIKPLRDRLDENDDITWDKYARLPPTDQRRQLLDNQATVRLKTRHGWRKKSTERMERIPLHRETTTIPLPPWKQLNNLILDSVTLQKPKEEYTEEELHQRAVTKIDQYVRDVTIYTDGSTNADQENGGAGVYIEDMQKQTLLEESYPAGKLCSSYGGECVALLHALRWLKNTDYKCLICTDSMSLYSALQSMAHGSKRSKKLSLS